MGSTGLRTQLRIAAALLAVALASGPGDAGAQTADPALQAEYDQAFAAMYRAPDDLDAAFRFADVAARMGDYEGAIGALERMLLFNPNLPRVRLELGALYLKLRSWDMARTYLNGAVTPDMPAPARRRVDTLLGEIESRQSPHRVTGSAQAGLRYQTNVGAAPNSGVVRAYGLDSTLDRAYTKQSDGNAFLSGTVSHVYDPGLAGGETWETNVVGYLSHQLTVTQYHLGLAEIDSGPRFDLFDGFSLRPYLLYGLVSLGDDFYYRSWGGGASLLVPLGQRWAVDLAGEGRDRSFHATERNPSADDKSGTLWTARARVRWALASDHQVGVAGAYARDRAEQAYESSRAWAISAEHQWALPSPFSVTTRPWTLVTNVQRLWFDYDAADSAVDPTTAREDRQWRIGATLNVGLAQSWSAIFQVQRDWTDSNLPNFKYTNTSGLVGLGYNF